MPLLKVNIKHRKVERLLFLRMMFSSIFLQFVIISNTEALPDIIKIGKRTVAGAKTHSLENKVALKDFLKPTLSIQADCSM